MDQLDLGPTDEYESHPKNKFSKRTVIHMNSFIMRINACNTEGALTTVKNDLQRSDLLGDQTAMSMLKRKMNDRARELKIKSKGEGGQWWA